MYRKQTTKGYYSIVYFSFQCYLWLYLPSLIWDRFLFAISIVKTIATNLVIASKCANLSSLWLYKVNW